MYCLCSNKDFDDIIDKQLLERLPFSELIKKHTDCGAGCGSCIPEIKKLLKEEDLLISHPIFSEET